MSPGQPDPEDFDYFSYNWCDLCWSPWIPFTAAKEEFREIPAEPGIYRIRPAGKDFLMYIGETKRTVHQRLQDLRMELRQNVRMPWADPHTEAAALWSWKDDGEFAYECSAAPLDASLNGRRGMECFLLYRYRQEYGGSPLCNFGRFHPRYRRSTTRRETERGGKLGTGQKDNPAGGPSFPPMPAVGDPGDLTWMGLAWSRPAVLSPEKIASVSPGQGIYLLLGTETDEILTIGHTGNCAKKMDDLCKKPGNEQDVMFSFHAFEKPVLPHNLREMENDLIGNFFERYRKAPENQFRSLP
jgi:hypothetical protein